MSVSAAQVRELRDRTGAGMMDCKKALTETSGDFEKAIDWLRTKGLAAAAKKAGRVAAEGLVAVAVDSKKAVAVEINSETDFLAKNENFQQLVSDLTNAALNYTTIEELEGGKTKDGKNVKDVLTNSIATIGENIKLRRMIKLEISDGVIASYIHNSAKEGMGQIAVLIALESNGDKAKLNELGKQIAMHAAAARPLTLTEDEVDADLIEREKQIFIEQAKASGKPDNIIEKMIDGRIRKYLEEIVLLKQVFLIDGKSKISEIIEATSKEIGSPIELKSYVRFELGEGIEKDKSNFADEVAAASKS